MSAVNKIQLWVFIVLCLVIIVVGLTCNAQLG